MTTGTDGATALADALAFARVLGAVAVKGCSVEGGAGAALGWAGAGLALTTGVAGGAAPGGRRARGGGVIEQASEQSAHIPTRPCVCDSSSFRVREVHIQDLFDLSWWNRDDWLYHPNLLEHRRKRVVMHRSNLFGYDHTLCFGSVGV